MSTPQEYFKDLHFAHEESIKWIIRDVLPVGLQIAGGPPKSFKSTVINALPAIVARWPNAVLPKWAKLEPGMHGPSILLSGEATSSELAWLYRTGFGCTTVADTIFINDDSWDFRLDVKDRLNALTNMLNEVQPRICVVDPLRKYHAGDENDAAYVESILYPLRKWAIANESAIIVVHHARKDSSNQDEVDKMDPSNLRGSNAIFGAADSILMVRCLDRNIGKVRLAAVHKRAVGWTRDVLLGVPGATGWSKAASEPYNLQDNNVQRLLLQGMDPAGIAKSLKLSNESVNDSIDKWRRNSI